VWDALGYVYRPKDLLRGRKRMLEQGLRDITPGAREDVLRLLQDWRGNSSMERLIELMGEEKAKKLRELLDIK
jgi:hypothetical protein